MPTPLIIIVDDEAIQVSQWSQAFHELGEIVGVSSSDELFKVLSKRAVSAILLDNKLETETRYKQEIVGLIIAHALTVTLCSHIPIIFITGYGSSTTRSQLKSLGVTGYFEKPVALHRVKKLLQKELFGHMSQVPSWGPLDINALYQAADGASRLYSYTRSREAADTTPRRLYGSLDLKVLDTYEGIVEEINNKEKIARVRVVADDELVEAWFDYDAFVDLSSLKEGARVRYHVTEDEAHAEICGAIEIMPASAVKVTTGVEEKDLDKQDLLEKIDAWLDHDKNTHI